jgi:hypothetical protein
MNVTDATNMPLINYISLPWSSESKTTTKTGQHKTIMQYVSEVMSQIKICNIKKRCED